MRTAAPQPSRLDELVSNVKLALYSNGALQLGGPPGCDPYDSRLGDSPDDRWHRNTRRR
jgi:hypothetical protein